ncbi:MAG: sigma-70 family RNA polymerase sigma factor [Lachnospiraceae bacterium]|nr:sigma-70 family RNA polymerase sigma factor [Lachnospiraceae bacterium]
METKETELLVEKSTEGDLDAFEKLYQSTSRRVYFICLNFLHNEQDAKDAVQDTYLIAFKNIRQLKEPGKFRAWVERIAINRCKNILKKNQPIPVDDDVLKETLLTEDEFTIPEKYIIDTEKRCMLMDIMRTKLTELQYQTILLYYFNNLSVSEISEIMECSEGAVKNRLSKARTAIKKAVEKNQKDKDDKLFLFAGVPFLAKVFEEESKTLTTPALNTAILAGSAASGTAGATLKTGRAAISKNLLIGMIAGLAIVGGIVSAVIITDNSGKNSKQAEHSGVSSAGEKTSDNSVSSQTKDLSDGFLQEELNTEVVPSEDDLRTGKCGDNAFYSISDDGILTISGTGEIYDYGSEEGSRNPWCHYTVPYFHTVVIENGITRIGNYAFLNCNQQDTLISDSVTEIGQYAFSECGSIETIRLPESIVIIEEGAFANSNLRKINIPKNVMDIPDKMCDCCYEMTEISISEGVETIGDSAFECCEGLEELELPYTLTTIGKYSFCFCRGIKELIIPENVSTINEYAFDSWEDDQTIYVKGKTKTPEGWDEDWKSEYVNIVWNE